MVLLKWKPSYSVKVKEIDDQHKRIFEILNELDIAIKEKSVFNVLSDIITKLIDYSIYHFKTEEKYFKKFKYKHTKEHMAEHNRFKEEIKSMVHNFGGEMDMAIKLLKFVRNWIDCHLIKEDQKYVKCFTENGLK